MTKGLEALTELKHCITSTHLNTRDFVDIALGVEKTSNAIEKELKAFEVLKKLFKSSFTYKYKLKDYLDCGWITKEEYDLLKEELE